MLTLTPLVRDPAVAIGASNVALFDLCLNFGQRPAGYHAANIGNLDTSDMIEFKHNGIALAAVNARVRG